MASISCNQVFHITVDVLAFIIEQLMECCYYIKIPFVLYEPVVRFVSYKVPPFLV